MIFVHDKGRMCNNILQYGHFYAWGREHGCQTMSMRFAYKYRYFHICHTRYHNFFVYLFAKYASKWHLLPTVDFDVNVSNALMYEQQLFNHKHIVATGWSACWYDLFLKYKNEIISLFQFDERVRKTPDLLLNRSPKSKCDLRIGIHIRRGDYRKWNNGRYFYSDQQYIDVIRKFLILHKEQTVQLFVCGNDPDLDEAAFQEAFSEVSICFPKGNPGEDLYLLSQCDRLIGAPSTFTLVASMYRDVPLYWIEDPNRAFTDADFGHFDQLFQQIR